MNKAFVLGAGLGTRLRPLTDQLPKPLVPVFHRPLISYAFDHLIAAGAQRFVVNTHHLPGRYAEAFPEGSYRGLPLAFRDESPIILDTAGGLVNVRDLLDDGDGQPFIVYNGDILTRIDLAPLIAEHEASGNLVTLALRSHGPSRNVAYDEATHSVVDLRGTLGRAGSQTCLFTGVYVVSPGFFEWLEPGRVESVVPVFLRMIEAGHRVGGVLCDAGAWWDLGDRASYLAAHRDLVGEQGAAFGLMEAGSLAIHPEAVVDPTAQLTGLNVIGPGAIVEAGAQLHDCVLWPESKVAASARLQGCILRRGSTAEGEHSGRDF